MLKALLLHLDLSLQSLLFILILLLNYCHSVPWQNGFHLAKSQIKRSQMVLLLCTLLKADHCQIQLTGRILIARRAHPLLSFYVVNHT